MESRTVRPNISELSVTLRQMARYAGGSKYKMDERMKKLAKPILETAKKTIDPAFSYSIYKPAELDERARSVLTGCDDPSHCESGEGPVEVCVCLCTLGKELETAVGDMMKKGEALEAALLDAAGVGLLESLGCMAFSRVREEAEKRGLFPGCRLGPGYGETPLEVQKQIFSLIDPGPLGVSLLDSCAMSPAKSLSFWVVFRETPQPGADVYKCGACGLKNCPFRIKTSEYKPKERKMDGECS